MHKLSKIENNPNIFWANKELLLELITIWSMPIKDFSVISYKFLIFGEIDKNIIIFSNLFTILYFQQELYKKVKYDFVNTLFLHGLNNLSLDLYPCLKAYMAALVVSNFFNYLANYKPESFQGSLYYNSSYIFIFLAAMNEGIYESLVSMNDIKDHLTKERLLEKNQKTILEKYLPRFTYGILRFHYPIQILSKTLSPLQLDEDNFISFVSILNLCTKAIYNSVSIVSAILLNSYLESIFKNLQEYFEIELNNSDIEFTAIISILCLNSIYLMKLNKHMITEKNYFHKNFEYDPQKHLLNSKMLH